MMTSDEYRELVDFLGRQFASIDQRFERLEQRVDDGFREVYGHFDAIYQRFERLEQEYYGARSSSAGSPS